jgi:photosystem II stability/assembly factor-like uncharacterized protein
MSSASACWEQVACRPGGTVAGLATATAAGKTLVFAATPPGVFRSSDTGRTWASLELDRVLPFAEAVVPSAGFAADRTIFICAGNELYRSSDAGEHWQPVLVGGRMLTAASAVSGERQTLLLAGTEADGVLRSEDAGRTWTSANPGLMDFTVLALALSPHFQHDRLGLAGTASGLYRTRNGARSWREVEMGLEDPAVQCLAFSPDHANDRLVLAGTESDGLIRSDDAGVTWQRVASLVCEGVTAVAFSTGYPAPPTIAAATEAGVAVSDDAGRTWRTTGSWPAAVLSLTFALRDDDDGEALMAGLHRLGVWRSLDGASWEPANEGLSARLATQLVLSPNYTQDRTLVTVGLQDGVCVSVDGGQTWTERNAGLDDHNPAVVDLAVSSGYAHDHTVYAATPTGVFVSRDACATWQATTWSTPGVAIEEGEIVSLALSPGYAQDRTIFLVTMSGAASGGARELTLWCSIDSGGTWQRWLVESGHGDSPTPVAVSPNYPDDRLVFIGLGGRILRPLPDSWRADPRSAPRHPTWRDAVVSGGQIAVTGLAVSPCFTDDRTVFASSSGGVFVSRNAGDSFQPWSEGLDPPHAVAVAISPGYCQDRLVYALGMRGTLWRRPMSG